VAKIVSLLADELTFSDLVDFLADHEGQEVYVEIGARDRESRERATLTSSSPRFMAIAWG